MTEGQRLLWKMRLHEWSALLAGAALGFAVVWIARHYFAVLTQHDMVLIGPLIGAGIGWIVHFAYDVLRSPFAASPDEPSALRLAEFFATPDAIVAPNIDGDLSVQLTKWLCAFAESHGLDSVWVLPHDDCPSSSEIYLVVSELSKSQRSALRGFGADDIRRQSGRRFDFLPETVQTPVYRVTWD